MAATQDEPATFRAVFRVAEFRALWTAHGLSVAGDQLARVALTFLVFTKTNSAVLSALTYALTFVPDLLGGPLLSGLADRYPRRQLMVAADLARFVLVLLMALPGMPLLAICALLVIVQLLASPFNAARGAVLPSVLDGDLYVSGNAVINITYQMGQLGGYVLGGALVAFTGSTVALLIDAGTFLCSAILVRFGLRHRAVPVPEAPLVASGVGAMAEPARPLGYWPSLRAGLRLVWHNTGLRALVGLACLSGFYVTAEGLSVPYAHELGGGALTAGLLFAANPAGVSIGSALLTRMISPSTRLRLLGPLATLSCAILICCAVRPNLTITVALWVMCGLAGSYQTVASAAFVRAVPDAGRGQAFGLALTSMRVAQGFGVALAGGLAQWLPPSLVVGLLGAVGTVLGVALATAWARSQGQLAAANAPAQA